MNKLVLPIVVMNLLACNGPPSGAGQSSTARPIGSEVREKTIIPAVKTAATNSKKKRAWVDELLATRPPAARFDAHQARAARAPDTPKGVVDPGGLQLENVLPPIAITSEEGSAEAKLSRATTAVGYMQLSNVRGFSRCVAWLYRNDVVVTNAHCVLDALEGTAFAVSFDYYEGIPWQWLQWYPCVPVLVSKEIDAAAFRCGFADYPPPGDTYGTLRLSEEDPSVGDQVIMIHQNCDYRFDTACAPVKKRSPVTLLGGKTVRSFEVAHDGGTLKGSSGAPILSGKTLAVVGMHHGGCTVEHACDQDPGDEQRSVYNLAIRATDLRKFLAKLPANWE